MNWKCMMLPAMFVALSGYGETVLNLPFDKADDLKGWRGTKARIVTMPEDSKPALEIEFEETRPEKSSSVITYELDVKALAGKTVQLSSNIKRDLAEPAVPRQGGKLMMPVFTPTQKHWPSVYMSSGKTDWQPLSLKFNVPADAEKAQIVIGIQAAKGKIHFRDLKVDTVDSAQ